MIIYECLINIIEWITNPWGYGGWRTIDWMMDNSHQKELKYKKKCIKLINILEIKKEDYILLKNKTNKLASNYRALEELLVEKDKYLKDSMIIIDQHKKLIVEKDKQISEITVLCNGYETKLNFYDEERAKYEGILDGYQKQLMLNYQEQQKIIEALKEQKNQIVLLTRKNKQLTEELSIVKTLLDKKKD